VNELVCNALKHAFPDGRKGEIRIGLHADAEQFVLEVSDNGVGLPANWDLSSTKTLGLQLVYMLVGQIRGTIHCVGNHGTTFRIVFADPPSVPMAQAERGYVSPGLVQKHASSKQDGALREPLPALS
jgi:two-component sensor histidine kinase